MKARVIAAHGRQYLVELEDGQRVLAFPRGKKSEVACGDHVQISRASADQMVIERVETRRSLLYRSNEIRQKLIEQYEQSEQKILEAQTIVEDQFGLFEEMAKDMKK